MKIRLFCPVCETPGKVLVPGQATWSCPACDHLVPLPTSEPALPPCAVCGNQELYRKKDFPHGLGMLILVGAFIAATICYLYYLKVLTWVFLLGSAAFDGLLYLWVKDVIVCYRCQAEHAAVPQGERFAPFELGTHERYRQEKIRKEELQRSTGGSPP